LFAQQASGVWTKERADKWSEQWGWLRGCNFLPSTAVNTLEMWQGDTFDPETIDRELGFAESIGMNCMRVFLHHLAWEQDKEGFKKRLKQYLDIADKHHISTMVVFFCDCFNATYTAGKQPEPKPGVHNSGWIRDPGDLLYQDPTLEAKLEVYVKDIITTFKEDKRIAIWDLYNEPGNSNYGEKSLPLLQNVFIWARTINPSQPLTAGVWTGDIANKLNKFLIANSDIISYHSYSDDKGHQAMINSLKPFGRPLLCTEYMARRSNSTFQNIMPILKKEKIGAFNWGLVAGKTNTIFKWGEALPDVAEPPVWFHDIFRKDGTPFSQEEVDLIKTLTGKN
jgi:hypothetical protein